MTHLSESATPVAVGARALTVAATLGVGGVLLLIVAVSSLAGDVDAIEKNRSDHLRRCQLVDHREFTRDRANVLQGHVVDQLGNPVNGAEIAVLAADDLVGTDAVVQVEGPRSERAPARVRTERDGHFAVRGLAYGAQHVVVSMPGFSPVLIEEVVLADGYGASGVDAVLRHGTDVTIRVVGQSGLSAIGIPLEVLPSIPGGERFVSMSTEDGVVCVPREAVASDVNLEVLAGTPPALLSIEIGPDQRAVAVLPEARQLCLGFPGATDGPVELTWIPHGAGRKGARTSVAQIEDECVWLGDAPRAGWDVLASTQDAAAFATIHPETNLAVFSLRDQRTVRIAVDGQRGGERAGIMRWYPTLAAGFGPRESAGLRGMRADHPLTVTKVTDVNQLMEIDLPFLGGFLFAETEGSATRIVRVDETVGIARASLRPRSQLLIETVRPFLPVAVKSQRAPLQVMRSDRFAHLSVGVPEGPVVVTTVFERGTASYPKGAWVGSDTSTVAFSALDRPGEYGGCIYGFVTDHLGRPVPDAEVYCSHPERRYPSTRRTTESGFYRFEGLRAGDHSVFARREGETSAVWKSLSAHLQRVAGRWESKRIDLQVWPGAIEIRVPRLAIDSIEFESVDDGTKRMLRPDSLGAVRVSNLFEGEYTARLHAAEQEHGVWELPIAVQASEDGPRVVSWP